MGVARTAAPIASRFATKYRVDEESGCWIWTASIRPNGYSQFHYSKGKNGYGHIVSYEIHVGPVPANTTIDHLCRNRACVNPAHLEAVPHRVNLFRADTPAAKNAQKTECPKGHPYEGANLYVHPTTGRRTCRTCQREANQAWRAKDAEKYKRYQRDYMRQWREARKSS